MVVLNWSGENKEVDFRVSVLPTLYGEKIVLRILINQPQLDMTKLGFEEDQLETFRQHSPARYGVGNGTNDLENDDAYSSCNRSINR